MRRFITDILLFCLFLAALTVLAERAYHLKLRLLRLPRGTNTLICGDSHNQTALNDAIIQGSVNICQSAEHFLFTYQKLKLAVAVNPGIKTVVLAVSYHSFSSFYDDFFLDHDVARQMDVCYFLMLDYQCKFFILRNNFPAVARAAPGIIRELTEVVRARRCQDYFFWGRYYGSDRSKLSDEITASAINEHFYRPGGEPQGFATYQAQYLQRIARFCSSRNIVLVLINTPVSPQYAARIPGKFIDNYYATVKPLASDTVRFLDYHDLELPADCYGDGDHLNRRGAMHFSKLVVADLAAASRSGRLADSGAYFCRVRAGDRAGIVKAVLLR